MLTELRRLEPGIEVELVATDQLTNLLRHEADIALRMLRPAQASLVARKLGEIGLGAYAHRTYLQRAGSPRQPADLLQHALVGFATDDSIERGFAAQGLVLPRSSFGPRTDDQVAYAHLVAAGGGIGFLAHYATRQWPELQRVLPQLPVPPLPCWLAVHREIRSSPLVRRVVDFLAKAVPLAVAGGG